jgi:signal transduction histidine kinase
VPQENGAEKGDIFMSYLKSVTIIGFVRADPEQRQARNNNGSKFTVLSVATQRSWKNTDAEWASKTEWHQHEAVLATERFENGEEDFGEVLRHELNNPLTGIQWNAELLLAKLHRKNDGKLPLGGKQRLETIAALAVRLRETVRRLTVECEVRQHPVH